MAVLKNLTDAQKLEMALKWANKITRSVFDNDLAMGAGDLVDIATTAYTISLLNFFVNMGAQMVVKNDKDQKVIMAAVADEYLEKLEKLFVQVMRALPDNAPPMRLAGFGFTEDGQLAPAPLVPADTPFPEEEDDDSPPVRKDLN